MAPAWAPPSDGASALAKSESVAAESVGLSPVSVSGAGTQPASTTPRPAAAVAHMAQSIMPVVSAGPVLSDMPAQSDVPAAALHGPAHAESAHFATSMMSTAEGSLGVASPASTAQDSPQFVTSWREGFTRHPFSMMHV